MPLDASVDKIRVRGRTQLQNGNADQPPTLFPTVLRLVNKPSHSRIKLGLIDPATNQSDTTASAYYNPATGDWWADVIAVDDVDVMATGQTQWGQWGVNDLGARYYIEPKLADSTNVFYGDPVTGAPKAQGSGGVRTAWIDSLTQLADPTAIVGGAGLTLQNVQDAVAALFAAGTQTGIGYSYDGAGHRLSSTVTVTGDLPEASATRLTTAQTAANLLGVTTPFGGSSPISQPLPAATPGRVLAIRAPSTADGLLTLTPNGTDTVGDLGNVAYTPPLRNELVTLHCTFTGAWQFAAGNKSQSALAATFKSIGDPARSPARPMPAQPPQTLVSIFQSGHGWSATGGAGATNLNDTTDVGLGTQSAKLVTDTANTAATLDSPTTASFDATGKDIKLLIKVEGIANLADLRLYAGDATLSNYRNWNFGGYESVVNANFIKDSDWCWVTYMWDHASEVGTTPRSALTHFRLRAQAVNGQSMVVHLGAIALVPESSVFPRGVVSFTYDDGRSTGLSLGRRKLDQYGWGGTAFPIRDKLGTSGVYCTLADLQAARNRSGWEIGCHSDLAADHDAGFDTLTAAQVEADLLAERRWLYDNGLGTAEGFAWPQGKSTPVQEAAAARVVAYARNNSTVSRETFPPPMPMRVRSFQCGPSTTLTQLQAMVDKAVASRGWLCLTFHELVTTPSTSLDTAQSVHDGIADYIAGLGAAGPAVLPMIDVIRANGLGSYGAAPAIAPDVQEFTTSGTWTKPAGATRVEIIAVGPGGSGGSGARRASGTASAGGGGGAGGGISRRVFRAADLAATETVTIGTVGTPGPATTSDDTNGTAAAAGTVTSFGTTVKVRATAGGAGGAGGTSAASAATGGVGDLLSGAAGGLAAVGAVGASAFTAAGTAAGAAGGGVSTTPAAFAGGTGGSGQAGVASGGTLGASGGGNGSAGVAGNIHGANAGGGGAGGGSNISGAGGTGGAGGAYGSGAGGGGSSINGSASGAGGTGGAGYCIVISD